MKRTHSIDDGDNAKASRVEYNEDGRLSGDYDDLKKQRMMEKQVSFIFKKNSFARRKSLWIYIDQKVSLKMTITTAKSFIIFYLPGFASF